MAANTITYYDDEGRPYTFDKDTGKLISSPNANDSTNKTGVEDLNPKRDVWKGGGRTQNWAAPQFTQHYGNYTGMFPSMGQQVGQALFGTIQPKPYLPSWFQETLPPRLNSKVNMQSYYGNNPALANQFPGGMANLPGGVQPGGNVNPQSGVPGAFSRTTMGNPYPLNAGLEFGRPEGGPPVTHSTNPFIGGYEGLTGYNPVAQPTTNPGGGTWTTPPPQPLFGTPTTSPTTTPNAPGFNPAPYTPPTNPNAPYYDPGPPRTFTPVPPPKPPEAPNPPGYVPPPRNIPPLPEYRPGLEPVTRYPVNPVKPGGQLTATPLPGYTPPPPPTTWGTPRGAPSPYDLYMGGTPPTADAQMINSLMSLFRAR
jgi:hypothetical protein